MCRFGELMSLADSCDPLPHEIHAISCRYDIYQKVWQQASDMRKSGRLLTLAENIFCPVLAIHGDYDPHPAAGVNIPLPRVLKDFRFILLEKCGHAPWIERAVKDSFFSILKQEILQKPATK